MDGNFIKMVVLCLIAAMLMPVQAVAAPLSDSGLTDIEGLVAYYSFDDGTADDNSGNGNDGVIYGAESVDGVSGMALSFDGVDDYVDCGDDEIFNFGTGDFTLEAWIKTDMTNFSQFLGKTKTGENPNDRYGLRLNNDYSGQVDFICGNGITNRKARTVSPFAVNDNEWHHVVGLREGDNLYLYVDGVRRANTTGGIDLNVNISEPFYMAKRFDGSYFNGTLDEARVYRRALSEEEIKEHYTENHPTLIALDDAIQDLPDDAFKNNPDERKNAFSNKLDAVIKKIEEGEYQEAINKLLEDIRAKADGSLGGNPNDDWITDPEKQEEICSLIDDLIAYLETMF